MVASLNLKFCNYKYKNITILVVSNMYEYIQYIRGHIVSTHTVYKSTSTHKYRSMRIHMRIAYTANVRVAFRRL